MRKSFNGIHPQNGVVIGSLGEYLIYIKIYANQPVEWINIKLVAKVPQQRKANFSIAWNGERFAHGSDIAILREHYPHLESELVRCVSDWSLL